MTYLEPWAPPIKRGRGRPRKDAQPEAIRKRENDRAMIRGALRMLRDAVYGEFGQRFEGLGTSRTSDIPGAMRHILALTYGAPADGVLDRITAWRHTIAEFADGPMGTRIYSNPVRHGWLRHAPALNNALGAGDPWEAIWWDGVYGEHRRALLQALLREFAS